MSCRESLSCTPCPGSAFSPAPLVLLSNLVAWQQAQTETGPPQRPKHPDINTVTWLMLSEAPAYWQVTGEPSPQGRIQQSIYIIRMTQMFMFWPQNNDDLKREVWDFHQLLRSEEASRNGGGTNKTK